METIDDPFEKHQELIAHLMLSHMSSFSVMTYLTSMLGHSHILSSEAFGVLNERQRESLDIVINNIERLQQHLGIFIITIRLMFSPDRIYEIDCVSSQKSGAGKRIDLPLREFASSLLN